VKIVKIVENLEEKLTSLENEILPVIKHKLKEFSRYNYVIMNLIYLKKT